MDLRASNKTRAKIQNFMQINCNTLSLQTVYYLQNASLYNKYRLNCPH